MSTSLKDEKARLNTIKQWGLMKDFQESGLSSSDYMKRCFEIEGNRVFRKRARVAAYKNLK
jgi:hypothetical protein